MKRLSLFALLTAVGLAASVTAPALAVKGSHSCPCGPIGMLSAPKYECDLDNGAKLKLYCTNESENGNFILVYCPRGGGAGKVIGGCLFKGGRNKTEIIPPTGQPCFIVRTNTDGGTSDGLDWDKIVWVFDVKNCRETVYCFKDGRQIGDPACYGPDWFRDHPFTPTRAADAGREFLEATFGPLGDIKRGSDATDQGQTESTLAVDKVDLRGGYRDLRFVTGGDEVQVKTGDRITIEGITLDALSDIHPRFEARHGHLGAGRESVDLDASSDDGSDDRAPRPSTASVVFIATSDFVLTDDEHLAMVTNSNPGRLGFEMVAVDNAEVAEALLAAVWRDWPQPVIPGVVRVNAVGEIDGAAFVVDVNGDRHVDLKDISQIIMNWGTGDISCDVNEDGVVGFEDLSLVLGSWPQE